MIVLMLHVERILTTFDFYYQSWPDVIGAGFFFFLFLFFFPISLLPLGYLLSDNEALEIKTAGSLWGYKSNLKSNKQVENFDAPNSCLMQKW